MINNFTSQTVMLQTLWIIAIVSKHKDEKNISENLSGHLSSKSKKAYSAEQLETL